MTPVGQISFDPETIQTLKLALDEAWAALPADAKTFTTKSVLAQRILKLAAQGERDPVRLRARAILRVAEAPSAPVEGRNA
jgi:hypothetical protein